MAVRASIPHAKSGRDLISESDHSRIPLPNSEISYFFIKKQIISKIMCVEKFLP